jgi:ribose transport system ATP-binding protein
LEQLDKKKILSMTGICKSYPGVRALDNVDFDLYAGETHCLVGKNGSGKSTLIEILAGSIRADKGKIELFEKTYDSFTPAESLAQGIGTIHQVDHFIEEMTVAENVLIDNLQTNKGGFFSFNKCSSFAKEIFKFIDVYIDPKRIVATLSPVERKILSIARAFSQEVKILILDEPTASLDKEVEDKLFKVINNVKEKGVGIIYISHNLNEIFKLKGRVTILRDGKKVSTDFVKDIDRDTLITRMIGAKTIWFGKKEKNISNEDKLEIKNYSSKNVVENISFEVKKGEVFGIGGLVGSGRTELLRMLFGADKKDSGGIFYGGKDITPKSPVEAIKNGVGLLTEDRKSDGLIMEMPICTNISLVDLVKNSNFFLRLKKERKDTEEMTAKLNIKAPSVEKIVKFLSGGNQQKVVLAKWLLAESKIIMLDEPTIGIDIGAKEEIYELINNLAERGKIFIIISSDNQELANISDRVGIMKDKSMIKILEGNEVTEENILKYSL